MLVALLAVALTTVIIILVYVCWKKKGNYYYYVTLNVYCGHISILLLLERIQPCSQQDIPLELNDLRLPSKSPMYDVLLMSVILMSDNYRGVTYTG